MRAHTITCSYFQRVAGEDPSMRTFMVIYNSFGLLAARCIVLQAY